jgi:hypothetical protein
MNDHAIRISNKEPADAPRLIRQRVNDLKAESDSFRMHRVNSIDLLVMFGCGSADPVFCTSVT